MIDKLINGPDISKGIVVTLFGMSGVFLVLILFYFLIILLLKLLPCKQEE